MKSYADGYVSIAQKYTPSSGGLAEQFDKNTGAPLSAVDLTWSYASFLTMAAARNNVLPASWGAGTANKVPSVCSASSASGTYAAATNTNWPSFPCTNAASVQTTFNVLIQTSPGQDIYVVGSIPELGSWDVSKAILLNAGRYRDDLHLWYGSVNLSAATKFEYKYVSKRGGNAAFEGGNNRAYTVPSSCRNSAAVRDTWQ
jgi:glucoamylase